jgi:hypothetical protein
VRKKVIKDDRHSNNRVKLLRRREPLKLAIKGKTFTCEHGRIDEFTHAFVDIPLDLLRDVKFSELADLPHNTALVLDASTIPLHSLPLHDIVVERIGFTMEISETPKLYRGYIPVERWIKLIHKLAKELGFDVDDVREDENFVGFWASVGMEFDQNMTIEQALEASVIALDRKVANIVKMIEEQVEKIIKGV